MYNKTHYDTLHVSRNAKPADITAAYERLIQKCRDELRPNADASRYLNAIAEAHAVLTDPEQRAAYDLGLQEQDLTKSALKKASAPALTNAKATNIVNHTAAPPDAVISGDAGTSTRRSRVVLAAMCASLLAGVIGFLMFRSGSDVQEPESRTEGIASGPPVMDDAAIAAALAPPATDERKSGPVTEITIPEHDAAAIEKFFGPWRGSADDTGRWRKLEVRRKSGDSFVFQLDSKSGSNIGEVYGVAEFRDGYALFFNKEYSCSMVFTMKSDTLNLSTSGCQAYHDQGSGFDGSYTRPKPETPQNTARPPADKPRKKAEAIAATPADAAPAVAPATAAPAANPGKLYRFVATVKDAEGKTQRIELVAASEAAARAILRDYRGNPTVVRIRRAWF